MFRMKMSSPANSNLSKQHRLHARFLQAPPTTVERVETSSYHLQPHASSQRVALFESLQHAANLSSHNPYILPTLELGSNPLRSLSPLGAYATTVRLKTSLGLVPQSSALLYNASIGENYFATGAKNHSTSEYFPLVINSNINPSNNNKSHNRKNTNQNYSQPPPATSILNNNTMHPISEVYSGVAPSFAPSAYRVPLRTSNINASVNSNKIVLPNLTALDSSVAASVLMHRFYPLQQEAVTDTEPEADTETEVISSEADENEDAEAEHDADAADPDSGGNGDVLLQPDSDRYAESEFEKDSNAFRSTNKQSQFHHPYHHHQQPSEAGDTTKSSSSKSGSNGASFVSIEDGSSTESDSALFPKTSEEAHLAKTSETRRTNNPKRRDRNSTHEVSSLRKTQRLVSRIIRDAFNKTEDKCSHNGLKSGDNLNLVTRAENTAAEDVKDSSSKKEYLQHLRLHLKDISKQLVVTSPIYGDLGELAIEQQINRQNWVASRLVYLHLLDNQTSIADHHLEDTFRRVSASSRKNEDLHNKAGDRDGDKDPTSQRVCEQPGTESAINFIDQEEALELAKTHLKRFLALSYKFMQSVTMTTPISSGYRTEAALPFDNPITRDIEAGIHANFVLNKESVERMVRTVNALLQQCQTAEYHFQRARERHRELGTNTSIHDSMAMASAAASVAAEICPIRSTDRGLSKLIGDGDGDGDDGRIAEQTNGEKTNGDHQQSHNSAEEAPVELTAASMARNRPAHATKQTVVPSNDRTRFSTRSALEIDQFILGNAAAIRGTAIQDTILSRCLKNCCERKEAADGIAAHPCLKHYNTINLLFQNKTLSSAEIILECAASTAHKYGSDPAATVAAVATEISKIAEAARIAERAAVAATACVAADPSTPRSQSLYCSSVLNSSHEAHTNSQISQFSPPLTYSDLFMGEGSGCANSGSPLSFVQPTSTLSHNNSYMNHSVAPRIAARSKRKVGVTGRINTATVTATAIAATASSRETTSSGNVNFLKMVVSSGTASSQGPDQVQQQPQNLAGNLSTLLSHRHKKPFKLIATNTPPTALHDGELAEMIKARLSDFTAAAAVCTTSSVTDVPFDLSTGSKSKKM